MRPLSILTVRQLVVRIRYGNLAALERRRWELAERWLRGTGIEVGALHNPLRIPPTAGVAYVDRMDAVQLRTHYPELADKSLVPVDIIDDGERLGTLASESQDFVVGNHFLEHCENPIGVLEAWMRVLRPGGVAYVTVPDMRFTFDYKRPETPWAHLLTDRRDGGAGSRQEHYREWAERVEKLTGEKAACRAKALLSMRYSIHFHVWTSTSLQAFVERCVDELNLGFNLRACVRNGVETIVVLEKHRD